jgi:hypothetical protein
MLEKAKTTAFEMKLDVEGNVLNYKEIMSLMIYGKTFEHSDENILQRVTYDMG